ETPTAGEIWVKGELIQMKTTRQGIVQPAKEKQVQRIRSRLAMVFQSFNLWSHMTVLENVIEAPVHVLGVPKAQAIEQAERLLRKVG
ncbi:ATP-binding cassette domain-containing protein, partial [Vibrio alginolyticus]|nr:histidine/lysine/arginine/ornithine ABC transporter ATP-binding protein [Vibrio alginolyticus]